MTETHDLQDEQDDQDAGPPLSASLTFSRLLAGVGLDPEQVRLVRHADPSADPGSSPYNLWRDRRRDFEAYQSHQAVGARSKKMAAPYWASFVATPEGGTLFVGLYRVEDWRASDTVVVEPHNGATRPAGSINIFNLTLMREMSDLIGLLYVAWGEGPRAFVQRAHLRDKAVVELRREFREPDFPGYPAFTRQLSEVEFLPFAWKTALAACRGVYLLTCPSTREQYVGAATGADGFLGRFLDYARSGHGGNVGLKSRDPSDYRVSILEVAGSAATADDILQLEARWKDKLQSREMGLNWN